MSQTIAVSCISCFSPSAMIQVDNLQDHVSKKFFALGKCENCDLVQIINRPQAAELPMYYKNISAQNMHGEHKSPLYKVLKEYQLSRESRRFLKLIPEQVSSAIDFGTGDGQFAAHLNQKGINVQAYDFYQHERWQHKNIPYIQASLETPLVTQHAQLLIVRHVLEHILTPTFFLSSAQQMKVKYLWIVVPNYDSPFRRLLGKYWYNWDPPRHLTYFTEQTLTSLLKRHNYETLYLRHYGMDELCTGIYRYCLLHGFRAEGFAKIFSPTSFLTGISAAISATVCPSAIAVLAREKH